MAQCLIRTRCMAFPRVSPALQFMRWKSGAGRLLRSNSAQKSQPTRLVRPKNAAEFGDIGLLFDTFVMPKGANLPGIFADPGARFELLKHQIKRSILDLRDMIVFRYITKKKLRIWEPRKVAPSLHKDMYTAFAEADLDSLRVICGEGLISSFQKRIATRGGIKLEWKLHRMLSRPKVMSNKAHYYMEVGLSRRQAIVRIHSLQSLSKFTPAGKLVEGSDQPKEVMEYVVIEKRYHAGKESPWYVWGTTEETTLERLAEQKRMAEIANPL